MTSFDYAHSLEELANSNDNDIEWTPGPVMITVATSLDDDTPMQIDLMKTLGFGNSRVRNRPYWPDEAYWLPAKYSHNDEQFRKEEIMPLFALPCQKAGFRVSSKGWDKRGYITVVCPRSRFHRKHRKSEVRSAILSTSPLEVLIHTNPSPHCCTRTTNNKGPQPTTAKEGLQVVVATAKNANASAGAATSAQKPMRRQLKRQKSALT